MNWLQETDQHIKSGARIFEPAQQHDSQWRGLREGMIVTLLPERGRVGQRNRGDYDVEETL